MDSAVNDYSPLERRVLNEFQRGLPIGPAPFAAIAGQLGVAEEEVLATLRRLTARGAVSRVGPVFAPNRLGASTLAAMAVPPERLAEVAALVSRCPEVNHNYEREHAFNLWFVVTARDAASLEAAVDGIERRSGLPVMRLPMLRDYFIDLAFDIDWGSSDD